MVVTDGKVDLASSILGINVEVGSLPAGPSESRYDGDHDGQIKGTIEDYRICGAPKSEQKHFVGRWGDPLKHYRIVFKGPPGTALHHLSLDEAFVALKGGAKGKNPPLSSRMII
jgi:hypothetical protein